MRLLTNYLYERTTAPRGLGTSDISRIGRWSIGSFTAQETAYVAPKGRGATFPGGGQGSVPQTQGKRLVYTSLYAVVTLRVSAPGESRDREII